MGLFGKKAHTSVCEMCGKGAAEGCGFSSNHVVQVSSNEPSWLPGNLRAKANGDYTWMCLLCGSYPAMAWPNDNGATAGMLLHLGKAHNVGSMSDIASGVPTQFDMRPVG